MEIVIGFEKADEFEAFLHFTSVTSTIRHA